MMLDKTENKFRFPAEWEKSGALLMAVPHKDSDWNYMLDEVLECFFSIVKAAKDYGKVIIVTPDLSETGKQIEKYLGTDFSGIVTVEIPTNDTWARDFGPITLVDENYETPVLIDYKFNGWGLKFASDKDNLITRGLFEQKVLKGELINRLGFVLEGGSIETDGKGTVLTTSSCLLSPNRNGGYTRQEIEDRLKADLNARRVLWLDYGWLEGDDTDSHIDTLARIAPNDTILYVKSYYPGDKHTAELNKMEQQLSEFRTQEGNPYNLIGLPLPEPIFDEDGNRLPATYANYLVFNEAVLLPTYNQKENDSLAEQMIRIAYPDHKVIPVDCRPLIKQHGSLHCMTMQLPLQ